MQVGDSIYLDYQASTPIDERVLQTIYAASSTLFANPHAADHALGWRAADAIESAAKKVANLFELQGDDVIFTSCASEANAMVVRTAEAMALRSSRTDILIGAADHSSIQKEAERGSLSLRHIPLDERGAPDPYQLKAIINDATALVSVIGVNNENGAIADLETISNICESSNVPLHVDLAQAPVALDVDLLELNIAFATISAHKLYGPKGVGALLAAPGMYQHIEPVIFGAGQQNGLRGGTLPTELIIGFGEACQIVMDTGTEERITIAKIRNHFVKTLEEKQIAHLVGTLENRHPGNALMQFPGQDASDLLARLQPQIAASTQSACASGSIEPSHVLRAMGYDRQFASECIRFSFGRFSNHAQANKAISSLIAALSKQA